MLAALVFKINYMTPLQTIEAWYNENKNNLPTTYQIDPHENITNVKNFIENSIIVLKSNKDKKVFNPYHHRLEKLFISLSSN
jgi:hypothetical protein